MKNKKSIVLVILIAAAMLAVILAGFIKDNDLLPPATGVPAGDPATGNTDVSNTTSESQAGSGDAPYNPLVEGKTAVAAGYEFTVLSAEVSKSPKEFEVYLWNSVIADENGVITNGNSYVFITFTVQNLGADQLQRLNFCVNNQRIAAFNGENILSERYEMVGMDVDHSDGEITKRFRFPLEVHTKASITVAFVIEDQYLGNELRLICNPYGHVPTSVLEDGTVVLVPDKDIAMILVSDLLEEGTK